MKRKLGITLCTLLTLSILVACGSEEPKKEKKEALKLDDLTVVFEGKELKLYDKLGNFMDKDWKYTDEADGDEMLAKSNDKGISIVKKKNQNRNVNIRVKNWTKKSMKYKNATIQTIDINSIVERRMPFELPGNITETSTMKDVIKAYGQPDSYSTMAMERISNSYTLMYHTKGEYDRRESFSIKFEDDKIDNIYFEAGDKKQKADKNTVFGFENLYDYKPLTTIDNPNIDYPTQLENGKIKIGDMEIGYLTPLSALVDSGWTIGNVYPDTKRTTVFFEKGEDSLQVTAKGEYVAGTELNKAMPIVAIDIFVNQIENPVSIVLPADITNKTTTKELLNTLDTPQEILYDSRGVTIEYKNISDDGLATAKTAIRYKKNGKLEAFRINYETGRVYQTETE